MQTIGKLGFYHYSTLTNAISKVLETGITETTMAQLIDGLPLESVAWEAAGHQLQDGHPLLGHEILCEGSVDRAKALRENFDPGVLLFDSESLDGYQSAKPGSKGFKLRLIGLVAVAIHQIAATLFETSPKLHNGDIVTVVSWRPEFGWMDCCGVKMWVDPIEPHPTLFFHISYMDYDQYPRGMADITGYWAEDRIFGGVVVFARGESGTEYKDLYLHPGRRGTTFRLWRPFESQIDQIVDFLLDEDSTRPCTFPLFVTDNHLHRHDPWDGMAIYRIYRDPWERKLPIERPPSRDVVSTGDYPEFQAIFDKMHEIADASDVPAYQLPGPGEMSQDPISNIEGEDGRPSWVPYRERYQSMGCESPEEAEEAERLARLSPSWAFFHPDEVDSHLELDHQTEGEGVEGSDASSPTHNQANMTEEPTRGLSPKEDVPSKRATIGEEPDP